MDTSDIFAFAKELHYSQTNCSNFEFLNKLCSYDRVSSPECPKSYRRNPACVLCNDDTLFSWLELPSSPAVFNDNTTHAHSLFLSLSYVRTIYIYICIYLFTVALDVNLYLSEQEKRGVKSNKFPTSFLSFSRSFFLIVRDHFKKEEKRKRKKSDSLKWFPICIRFPMKVCKMGDRARPRWQRKGGENDR